MREEKEKHVFDKILVTRIIVNGKESWIARPRLIETWKNQRRSFHRLGSDEQSLLKIEANATTKTEAVWSLRSNISSMLRDLNREKQNIEWKMSRLEEMDKDAHKKSMDAYKFKNQKQKNKTTKK